MAIYSGPDIKGREGKARIKTGPIADSPDALAKFEAACIEIDPADLIPAEKTEEVSPVD